MKASIVKNNVFNRFSLNQKIAVLIVIEVLGFFAVMMVAFMQIQSVGNETKQMSSINTPLFESINSIDEKIFSQTLNAKTLALMSSQSVEQNYHKRVFLDAKSKYLSESGKLQNNIASAEAFIRKKTNDPGGSDSILSLHKEGLLSRLFELRKANHNYNQLVLNQLFDRVLPGQPSADIGTLSELNASEARLLGRAYELRAELEKIKIDSDKRAIYVERIAISYVVLTCIIVVLFIIAMLLLIVRRNISKPLQLLTDNINRFTPLQMVEELEFEKNILKRQDELGRMARSFNRLKHDLWEQGEGLQTAINEAKRANHAKSVFLASASHDLRQPLNAMQMYIAALQIKVRDEGALEIIKDIDAVSVSTARLLNALLDVSELEVGAIKPHFEDFAIQDVFLSVEQSFSLLAHEKGLEFRVIPSALVVRSDPALLERILGNFMSNAIRYTESGGVLLGCRRQGSDVSIEVWDSGCGIPEHQLKPIFEDFYQIENKERDRGKGLGLGLALSSRLSNCLGHGIDVKSTVDSGSGFSVRVKNIGVVNTVKPTEALQTLTTLSSVSILLIEDDLDVLRATQQLLESWGCSVHSGRSEDEIMKLVKGRKESPPDVILADNRLPGGVNGTEVAVRVQQFFDIDIPAVIVTGDVEQSHVKSITEKGFPVMLKPIQPAKLRAIISHLSSS